MTEPNYLIRFQEGRIGGVRIVKITGRLIAGKSSQVFRNYFEQRMSAGIRFFIVDIDDVNSIDSTGIGDVAMVLAKARAKAGKILFIKPNGPLQEVFSMTHLDKLTELVDDLPAALSIFQVKRLEVPPHLEYEDKYVVVIVEENGDKKMVVMNDGLSEEPQRMEYKVRDIPAEESPKTFGPKFLLLVVLTSIITLSLLIYGLIWAARATSSIAALALIFTLALLFFIVLSALVLRLSGHLSEQATARLFGGVLGKLPGLDVWLNKPSAKKKMS